jgi:hypothetical protein
MAELLVFLLITAVVTAATKSGRAAMKNFAASAHTATGWRTPRKALDHYSGRAGEHAGRLTAAAARGSRTAAGGAGRRATAVAGRRWQARGAAGQGGPLIWRTKPRTANNGGRAGGAASTTITGNGPAGTAGADGASRVGNPGAATGQGNSTGSPVGNSPAASAQNASSPAGTETSPGPAISSPTATTAPAGAERRRNRMTTRYALNLEPPQTDGEFLESCVQLGDVLKSLAEEISNWADGLGALNLPQSVLNPLHQVSDGITDAAAGATQAAKAFEDEFEDARDVAARGMHFTGQDAA